MENQAEYQVQKYDNFQVVNVEEFAMTPDRIIKQVRLIQDVMESIMKKNEHYGVIPGTNKPTLLKPGAEKLSVTFRLVPKYDIKQVDMPNGHREFQIVCNLIHAPSGQFFGQGLGSCSTMENKYRYRNADPEITDRQVPKKYWDIRKAGKMDEAQNLLGGKGFVTKKVEGSWMIAKLTGEKQEYDNPADYYNTVMKMAKKRAHVDAVLTATAASDIFTQDIEDLPPEIIPGNKPPVEKAEPEKQNGHTQPPTETTKEEKTGVAALSNSEVDAELQRIGEDPILSEACEALGMANIPAGFSKKRQVLEKFNELKGASKV